MNNCSRALPSNYLLIAIFAGAVLWSGSPRADDTVQPESVLATMATTRLPRVAVGGLTSDRLLMISGSEVKFISPTTIEQQLDKPKLLSRVGALLCSH